MFTVHSTSAGSFSTNHQYQNIYPAFVDMKQALQKSFAKTEERKGAFLPSDLAS